MSEFELGRTRGSDDTDLLCVEVSALGAAPPPFPRVSVSCAEWREPPAGCRSTSSTNQMHEDFLRSLLLKTDAYRPRQESLECMENAGFLSMRRAVVEWFASVSVSYGFANETAVAALSNFDRYVSVTVEPVKDHLLLQLAAYVALLVASKMGETCPLRMKSLASLTGRMFTPLQVQKIELEMISKLHFRLAPPSADETLQCLSALLHETWAPHVPVAEVLSTGACYLKKARARTCWFRHSPYTLAVAALATAYNSLGLGQLRRRLLRECDSRARNVTGRGVDISGVAACAEAMAIDELAAAAAAATARMGRGGTDSPEPGTNNPPKEGWGSPTGVAQGAELLQGVAFSTVGGVPLVEDFLPSPPKSFSPCALPTNARAPGGVRASSAARTPAPVPVPPRQAGEKRGLHQTSGSCFVPCGRRPCVDGGVGRRREVHTDSEEPAYEQKECEAVPGCSRHL